MRSLSCCLVLLACAACATNSPPETVRFASFNAAMGLGEPGELGRRLKAGDDPALHALAQIVQTVRPDVLLLNEFDAEAGVDAAALLQRNYLSLAHDDATPIEYGWSFRAPVNTGVDSGLDIDGNGVLGEPADAWGFGQFPGQYAMLVLSRLPLVADAARTFQHFRWQDLPGALQPQTAAGTPWYPAATWSQLRLSSKSHWDVPVRISGATVHFLVSHPTPPVFDGAEDRNGRRNFDEIRLWADYLRGSTFIYDDSGVRGGLPTDAHFVIAGDQNADPVDGDSYPGAIAQLLDHELVDSRCVPRSAGGAVASELQGGINRDHQGDPAADTGDFSDRYTGNLRIDYVLPSHSLGIRGCGVYWPTPEEPGHALIGHSDHRMVWLDIVVPGAD